MRLGAEIRKVYIYKITNPNGRVYIGRTIDVKRRMADYRYYKGKGQKLLLASINKYGYDSHKFEVIDEFEGDINIADSKEMFWIRSYMSNRAKYPEQNGMNCTDGASGLFGYRASEETKAKLRAHFKSNPPRHMLGKKHSNETKLKQSLAKKGKVGNRIGSKMSESLKEKLREINKGRSPVNKGVKYQMTDEERRFRFGAQNIGHTRNRGRKMSEEVTSANRLRLRGKEIVKKWKKVDWLDLDGNLKKTFPCIKYASKELGLSSGYIVEHCKGRKPNSVKWKFKYSE